MGTLTTKYNQFMEDAEFNRFGIMSIFLLVNTAFGAMVCYAVSEHYESIIPLIVCAISTTIPNVFGLAVSPMKWLIWGNIVGISINLLIFASTLM